MTMQATSHFVGITMDSAYVADLFVELQHYFTDNNLLDAIEFQNVLSLHITLYYLGSSLQEAEKRQLISDISELNEQKELTVSGLHGKYFGEPGNERVCYIGCETNKTFRAIHQFLADKYKYIEIPENKLDFVPHISLFRIKDAKAFAPHKAPIDKIIHARVQSIEGADITKGVHLYQVNSKFHPEIQIRIA